MKFGTDLIWQLQGEPLGSVLEQTVRSAHAGPDRPRRFVHIVNLFVRDGELPDDQRETVRAIGRAQRSSEIESIALFVVDPKDRHVVELEARSLTLAFEVVECEFDGAMPQAFEVIEAGYRQTDENDCLVFANADICPALGFYDAIDAFLMAGANSMVINRRSVFGFWPGVTGSQLAAFSVGAAHPGFDCFVFPRSMYADMVPSRSVVGSPYVMLSVLLNLVAVSSPLVVLTDAHLTYHYGDDRAWSGDGRSELVLYNLDAASAVCDGHRSGIGEERLKRFFSAFPNWEPAVIRARNG